MFQRYGLIEGRDIGEMVDYRRRASSPGARGCPGDGASASARRSGGGGGWMADACSAGRPRGARARQGDARQDRRAPPRLRHLAEPRRRHGAGRLQDRLRGACRAGAALARDRWHRRGHDGRATRTASSARREALARLAAETEKPILMWSYTLPAQRSVRAAERGGPAALHQHPATARAPCRAMADYRALRERFLRPIEVSTAAHCGQGQGSASCLAAAGPALRGVGGPADPRRLRHRRRRPPARLRARPRRPSPPRRQSAAPWRSRCSRPTSCTRRMPVRWRSTCARPATCAPPTSDVLAEGARRHAPGAAYPRRAGAADGARRAAR